MCYYNGQKVTRSEFIALKQLEKAVRNYDFLNVGVHNGFSYKPCAILVANEDKTDFEIVQAEWGYIADYIPDRAEAEKFRRMYTTLNFKAENMFISEKGRKAMWADAAIKRRCLVLSTGIIESRHVPKLGKKGQPLAATDKFPYEIGIKGKEYFWFAGIYNEWLDQDTGELIKTFALGTTQANEVMKQIHNSKRRMPSILSDELAWEWLMTNPSKERLTEIALTQIPSNQMEFCTIEKGYQASGESVPFKYEDLPEIDLTFLDTEVLLYPEDSTR